MPAVLELSVVALLVSVAILYSIWALLPWSRRLALLLAVDRWAAGFQGSAGTSVSHGLDARAADGDDLPASQPEL